MAPPLLSPSADAWYAHDRSPPRQAGFALQQARVCLDCDCLTLEQSCPWCDRDGTVPLASWFRPMEERQG